jgi:spore coat polysaccharide biosynthesis predicted glycosyltransferase SpsG
MLQINQEKKNILFALGMTRCRQGQFEGVQSTSTTPDELLSAAVAQHVQWKDSERDKSKTKRKHAEERFPYKTFYFTTSHVNIMRDSALNDWR